MKVNSAVSQNINQKSKPAEKAEVKDPQAELKKKLEAKFGKKIGENKPAKKEENVVVSIDKKGKKEVSGEGFGDIKNNDPSSVVTQEKLKTVLSTGAFQFNPKERAALKDILS